MDKFSLSQIRQTSYYIPVIIFLFFGGFYLLTARGNVSEADGIINFMTTRALVETSSFSLPCDLPRKLVTQGANDVCYGKYGIGLPLMSVPLYLTGRLISGPAPANPNELSLPRLLVSTLNQWVTAVTCSILYILGFKMTGNKKQAVELALVFGLFTIAWPYASTNFSQPIIGFLLLAAVAFIYKSHSLVSNLLAGIFLGGAFLVRLDSLPLIMVVGIWAVSKMWPSHKARSTLAKVDKAFISSIAVILLPIAASLIIFSLIQLNHFGSLFQTGYEGEAWSHPFLTGFFGQLFSFGKGIVFYSPLVLLVPFGLFTLYKEGIKDLSILAAIFFLLQLLIYSSWWSWSGGWAWGPRFLVPALPLFMIGLLPWLKNKSSFTKLILACFILVSFVVQLVGVTTDPLQYFAGREIVAQQLLFDPTVSPIWVQFQFLLSKEVSLLIPSKGHGVLNQGQTIVWAAVALLLLTLSGRELTKTVS
ncbi:MAG: hypothetical protein CL608_00715 [Anaerolineaceae bacterium]|nr:hypothetical protein [Anaerolineaceae bacterium]